MDENDIIYESEHGEVIMLITSSGEYKVITPITIQYFGAGHFDDAYKAFCIETSKLS